MLSRDVVDRLVHWQSGEAPVLSVYLALPAHPGELRGARARLHSLLKDVRELADSPELGHYERVSLRADVARVLQIADRLASLQGRVLAIFACQRAGLYEEVMLPRQVRDRAVVDATPYVRPLLAVLDESHRYCAAVVDRASAWLYEFDMGELEEVKRADDRALRNRAFAGWHGLDEYHVRNRAQELARRHYRTTAEAVEDLFRRTNSELLIVGGHEETVAEFLAFLPRQLRSRLAGTFVIDPHTITPAKVREHAEQVVNAYERDEETRLVAEVLERVASGGLGAAGLDWCLLAADEQAVQLLLVDDDQQAPGRVCATCGWLGVSGQECPVCGSRTIATADVIDEMAASAIDAGGRVEHVYIDSELSQHLVAAFLRFPVARPEHTLSQDAPAR